MSHTVLAFNVFTVPNMLFRGSQSSSIEDQSFRKIKVSLFSLIISLLIFIKPFRGP